jgi:hypothetical protein
MGPATRQEERGDAEVAPPQRPVLRLLGSQCRLSLRRVSSNLYHTPLYGSPCQSLPNDQHDDTSTAFQRHRCLSTCVVRGVTAIRLERGEFPFTTRATHTHTHTNEGGGRRAPRLLLVAGRGCRPGSRPRRPGGWTGCLALGTTHHAPRSALGPCQLPVYPRSHALCAMRPIAPYGG